MKAPRVIGSTDRLSLAVFDDWNPERLFMIIRVYIDESGTHAGAPVMILAGYIGRLGQWHAFDSKWERLLKREGLTHAHAKDIWHGTKEWKGWTLKQKIAFCLKTDKLCQQQTLCCFSVVLTEADYKTHYAAKPAPRKGRVDTMYGLAFRICLSHLPDMIARSVGLDGLQINFIMESGHKNAGDADRILSDLRRLGDPTLSPYVGTLSFAEKKQFPGLQAADMLAFSTYRLEQDGIDFIPSSPEATIQEAARIVGRRSPAFRLPVEPELLSALRTNLIAFRRSRLPVDGHVSAVTEKAAP